MVKDKKKMMKELENYEERTIILYKDEIRELSTLDNLTFKKLLLQKRIFSLEFFDRFYNTAICSLESEEAKEIARSLIREEYPLHRTTHREDCIYDLRKVGLSKSQILKTVASKETILAINKMFDLVKWDNKGDYDLRAVTSLRFGGEILSSAELDFILPELENRFRFNKENSRFYWPHREHDKKTVRFGEIGYSHSDKFGKILYNLIDSYQKLDLVKEVIKKSSTARGGFFQQFK